MYTSTYIHTYIHTHTWATWADSMPEKSLLSSDTTRAPAEAANSPHMEPSHINNRSTNKPPNTDKKKMK